MRSATCLTRCAPALIILVRRYCGSRAHRRSRHLARFPAAHACRQQRSSLRFAFRQTLRLRALDLQRSNFVHIPLPEVFRSFSLFNVGAGHARAGSGSSRSGVVVAAAALRVSHTGELFLRRVVSSLIALCNASNSRISSNDSIPSSTPSNPSRCSPHNPPRRATRRAQRLQALVEDRERTNPMHTAMRRLELLRAEKPADICEQRKRQS